MQCVPGQSLNPESSLPPQESSGCCCDGPGSLGRLRESLCQVVELGEKEQFQDISAGAEGGDLSLLPRCMTTCKGMSAAYHDALVVCCMEAANSTPKTLKVVGEACQGSFILLIRWSDF